MGAVDVLALTTLMSSERYDLQEVANPYPTQVYLRRSFVFCNGHLFVITTFFRVQSGENSIIQGTGNSSKKRLGKALPGVINLVTRPHY